MIINRVSAVDVLSKPGKTPGIIMNAEVFTPALNFVKKTLFFNKDRFLTKDEFQKSVNKDSEINVYDMQDKYITPALVDQHIHGGYGIDFNNASEEEIRNFLREIKKWGQGDILATFVPGKVDELNSQMEIIRNIINNPLKGEARIAGINLEGPFLSPKKAGIHPPENLMLPTVENLKKLNLENVKMITIAPELDKDYKATEYLNSLGVITSAGHSTATAEQVRESGVKQVTHLFNAMSGFHHRIPTIANEGLLNDNIYAEVNTAIELLDPKTVDLVFRVKPEDKIILISDALSGTNIKEDHFIMGGKRIDIDENGIAKDKEGILAGSIKLMGQIARRIVDTTQMTFGDFIKFASQNPAKNIGLENDYKIAEGSSPNFTIWNKDSLVPETTVIKGE